jgi:hypothetical protein
LLFFFFSFTSSPFQYFNKNLIKVFSYNEFWTYNCSSEATILW